MSVNVSKTSATVSSKVSGMSAAAPGVFVLVLWRRLTEKNVLLHVSHSLSPALYPSPPPPPPHNFYHSLILLLLSFLASSPFSSYLYLLPLLMLFKFTFLSLIHTFLSFFSFFYQKFHSSKIDKSVS